MKRHYISVLICFTLATAGAPNFRFHFYFRWSRVYVYIFDRWGSQVYSFSYFNENYTCGCDNCRKWWKLFLLLTGLRNTHISALATNWTCFNTGHLLTVGLTASYCQMTFSLDVSDEAYLRYASSLTSRSLTHHYGVSKWPLSDIFRHSHIFPNIQNRFMISIIHLDYSIYLFIYLFIYLSIHLFIQVQNANFG